MILIFLLLLSCDRRYLENDVRDKVFEGDIVILPEKMKMLEQIDLESDGFIEETLRKSLADIRKEEEDDREDVFSATLAGNSNFLLQVERIEEIITSKNDEKGRVPLHLALFSRSVLIYDRMGNVRPECSDPLLRGIYRNRDTPCRDLNGNIILNYLAASNVVVAKEDGRELSFSSIFGVSSIEGIFKFLFDHTTLDPFLVHILNKTERIGVTPLHSVAMLSNVELHRLMLDKFKETLKSCGVDGARSKLRDKAPLFLTEEVEVVEDGDFSLASICDLACLSGSIEVVEDIVSSYEREHMGKIDQELIELYIFGRLLEREVVEEVEGRDNIFHYAAVNSKVSGDSSIISRLVSSPKIELLILITKKGRDGRRVIDLIDGDSYDLSNNLSRSIEIIEIAKLLEGYPIEKLRAILKDQYLISVCLKFMIGMKGIDLFSDLFELFKKEKISSTEADAPILYKLRSTIKRLKGKSKRARTGEDSHLVELLNSEHDGYTMLQNAAKSNLKEVVRELLEFKGLVMVSKNGRRVREKRLIVDIDKKDSSGKSALYLAIESGNYEIVDILLNHGAEVTEDTLGVLHNINNRREEDSSVVRKTIVSVIDKLMERRVDLDQEFDHETALTLAVEAKNEIVALELVRNGAKEGIDGEIRGKSLLEISIKKRYLGALEKIFDPAKHREALHIAAKERSSKVLGRLYEKGAIRGVKDSSGKLPIEYAIYHKDIDSIKTIALYDEGSISDYIKSIDYSISYEVIDAILYRKPRELRAFVTKEVEEEIVRRSIQFTKDTKVLDLLYTTFGDYFISNMGELFTLALDSCNLVSVNFILSENEKSNILDSNWIDSVIERDNFTLSKLVTKYMLKIEGKLLKEKVSLALQKGCLEFAATMIEVGKVKFIKLKSDESRAIISVILDSKDYAEELFSKKGLLPFFSMYKGRSLFSIINDREGNLVDFFKSKELKVKIKSINQQTSEVDIFSRLIDHYGGVRIEDAIKEQVSKGMSELYIKILDFPHPSNTIYKDGDIEIRVSNSKVCLVKLKKLTGDKLLNLKSNGSSIIELKVRR